MLLRKGFPPEMCHNVFPSSTKAQLQLYWADIPPFQPTPPDQNSKNYTFQETEIPVASYIKPNEEKYEVKWSNFDPQPQSNFCSKTKKNRSRSK